MDLADLWADALKETGARTYDQALSCFAQKVAAAEREACAKVCDDLYETIGPACDDHPTADDAARAIRARADLHSPKESLPL